jgi:hypothetical protein
MSYILLLAAIVIAVLVYEQFIYKNPDELDGNGNPVHRKKRR